MPAYVIALLKVTDPAGYEAYRELAPSTVARYGGKYLARGGRFEVLEGDADLNRISMLEFDSFEQAKAWWASPEYEAAKPHRRKSAIATLIVTEGL